MSKTYLIWSKVQLLARMYDKNRTVKYSLPCLMLLYSDELHRKSTEHKKHEQIKLLHRSLKSDQTVLHRSLKRTHRASHTAAQHHSSEHYRASQCCTVLKGYSTRRSGSLILKLRPLLIFLILITLHLLLCHTQKHNNDS